MTSPPGSFDPAQDAQLVERCLAGDERAWESLVRRHERLVYAVARRYRLSEPDLGDVFQEVFTALVKGLPRLRDGRALCRWLGSTTDRIARTTAMRTRREQARSDSSADLVETMASDAPAVGATLETLEEQAMIRLSLAALPERCRRLLHALYYEDPPPTYAQLARRWGMPIGSLGATRARCLERARRVLEQLSATDVGISADAFPTSADEPSREERGVRTVAALASGYPATPQGEDSR